MIWLLAIQLAIGSTEHYEHAKQDFAQQNFSEAAIEVNAALHENPSMVPALVPQGSVSYLCASSGRCQKLSYHGHYGRSNV